MRNIIEKTYYKSPIFLQNLAVSMMGLKLARERYTREGDAMLTELMQSMEFNNEQTIALQNDAFVKIARHAILTTPYYQRWANETGIRAEDINSLSDIQKFPVIEKSYLRENATEFRSNLTALQNSQFVLHTSGTTGTPLSVYCDKMSRSRHYAFFSRLRSLFGVSQDSKRATLFGRIIMRPEMQSPPFWRYDYFQKNLLMSSYHLNQNNLDFYYQKLVDYKPDEIFAYPSSVYAIAKYIVEKQLKPIKLKLVMTTAEKLLPQQQHIIEQAFTAPVINQYGCTEMAFFCSSFENNILKFHPEHGFSEIRNADGHIFSEGNGEFIATGFINYSMPVIRYAIGDQIELTARDTKGWQQIGNLSGRTDDVIYTLDGTPIGRLDPIFKGGSGIQYAQIVQQQDGNVLLKLVPDAQYTQTNGDDLLYELRKRLGNQHPITLEITESIAKEKNGKFRPVICNYAHRQKNSFTKNREKK